MIRPRRALPLLVAAAGLLVAACGSGPAPAGGSGGAFPMQFRNCDADVSVDQAPQRVITNGVVPVDLLHAVGAADRIVARSGEQGQLIPGPAGAAVADVRTVSSDRPSTEIAAGSGADFMLAEDFDGRTTREQLLGVGITPVVVCGDNDGRATFEDVYLDLSLLGRLMGTEDVAEPAAVALRQRVDEVSARAATAPRRTVAGVSVYENTLYFDGRLSMLNSMMERANLQNVFADSETYNFEAGPESLIARDPDVVVLSYGSSGDTFEQARDFFRSLPGVAEMSAVRRGAIVGVTFNDSYSSSRAADGLASLTDQLGRLP